MLTANVFNFKTQDVLKLQFCNFSNLKLHICQHKSWGTTFQCGTFYIVTPNVRCCILFPFGTGVSWYINNKMNISWIHVPAIEPHHFRTFTYFIWISISSSQLMTGIIWYNSIHHISLKSNHVICSKHFHSITDKVNRNISITVGKTCFVLGCYAIPIPALFDQWCRPKNVDSVPSKLMAQFQMMWLVYLLLQEEISFVKNEFQKFGCFTFRSFRIL